MDLNALRGQRVGRKNDVVLPAVETANPAIRPLIPECLQILGEGSGLPQLPVFSINLYLPRAAAAAGDIAIELAGHIREQLGKSVYRAA
jgi:hypothetical protein